jgi:hypothetical protein
MPSSYNLPRSRTPYTEQDTNLYNKLPYHLAAMAAGLFPIWHVYDKLYGSREWQQNEGTTLKGVAVEHSPIGRQMFFPKPITAMPNRDVHEVKERTETAVLYRHNYETPYINFLGSFQDFRKKQIPFAMEDLTRQIAVANDQFIRTFMFHYCPNVLIAGKPVTGAANGFDGGDFIGAPSGIGSIDGSTAKSTAWLQQALSYVGSGFTYKLAKKCGVIMMEDLQAPAFEGMQNMPKQNERIKGKFVIVGSNEAYEAFEFDEYIQSRDKHTISAEDAEFSGGIGSRMIWKTERFPLRIADDGTFPEPQTYESNPNAFNYGETVPNPAYINANFEVAFVCAAGAYETIKVGPPPAEFAKKMSAKTFAELRWNGEARITDNILINIGVPEAPIFTTNKYGEFVQLFADTVHGILPVNRRNVFMVIYRRNRVRT